MERPKDYYRILGVERDASADAIKRAYRKLARKLHPDRQETASVEDFRDVQVAYETLADAERRRRYDESLRRHERGWAEPLAWPFVGNPATGGLRRPVRPTCLTGEILLTRTEASAGGVLPLSIPVETQCPTCEGTGGYVFDCPGCFGDGSITRRVPVPLHLPRPVSDGTVFQVRVDEPSVPSVWLTVHILPY